MPPRFPGVEDLVTQIRLIAANPDDISEEEAARAALRYIE